MVHSTFHPRHPVVVYAGRLLGLQVPPGVTLIASGNAIILGASVNSQNSMAGAFVELPDGRCG